MRATLTRLLPAAAFAALLAAAPVTAPGAIASVIPDDPNLGEQWGIDALHLPEAWDTSDGDGIVIAIIDTGVDLEHPDLRDRLVDGHDFVDGDDEPQDENGHGTHVAGIAAAASDNGVGVSGAAPGARIMPVRVLDADGAGDEAAIAEAITWAADNGADVINLSLGEVGFASRIIKGGPLNRAIRGASEAGTVVIAASGNEGTARRPFRIAVPVVVVGAVDDTGAAAEFSNFGDQRAVVAPGVGILSTAPTGPSAIWPDGTEGYELLDGTSMAAPFVSGVAALLLAQGRTPDDVRSLLFDTAANPEGDTRLGAGLVDAAAAVAAPVEAATGDSAGDGDGEGAGDGGDGFPVVPVAAGVAALAAVAAVLVTRRR